MRLFIAVVIAFVVGLPVNAQQENTDVVAKVSQIQEAAIALQDALPRALEVGSDIQLGDIVSTGKNARLELEFTDGTIVRLGERAQFSVVEYVIGQNGGNAVMRMLEGAFQLTSGSMMQLADSSMTVETETATIGIRGTTVWGGPLDSAYEIVMLEGKGVVVETDVGRVELLQAGGGTSAPTRNLAPSEPLPWAQEKIDRAIASITFN